MPPKNGSPTNGHSKKEEDAPPVKDVPPFALEFFDGTRSLVGMSYIYSCVLCVDMQVSFKDAVERKSFCEALYFATLTQEVRGLPLGSGFQLTTCFQALILLTVETLRFKSASVVKMHKLGNVRRRMLLDRCIHIDLPTSWYKASRTSAPRVRLQQRRCQPSSCK